MNLTPPWRRLALLAAAFSLHAVAHAHATSDPLTTTVTRLQPSVTYSDDARTPPLQTYLAYSVSIANTGRKSVKAIRFTGGSSVTGTGETASVVSVEGGAACTVGADGRSVDCAIGTLMPGQAAPTFTVLLAAPSRAAGSTLPEGVDGQCASTDCVSFAGATLRAPEDCDDDRYPPPPISRPWGPVDVPLAAINPNAVRSVIPKAGATVYTGEGATTSTADPLTTTVTVPAGPNLTTADIVEASTGVGCSVLATCYTSVLTIPGTFSPYLTVTLRLNGAAAPKGTKIGSILISYDGLVIGDCASATTPRTDGIPCIAGKRTVPVAQAKPETTTRTTKRSRRDDDCDDGPPPDFEWTLINTKNGSIKIF